MNHYKILVSRNLLCDEFVRLVQTEAHALSSWNNNRYGYISQLLKERISDEPDTFCIVQLALEFPKTISSTLPVAKKRKLTEPLLGKKYTGAGAASSTLRTIICLIEFHLSCLKMIQFDSSYQQNLGNSDGYIVKSSLFKALPDLPKCIILMSTPSAVKRHKDHIPESWFESYEKHISPLKKYKTKSAAIASYKRLVFTLGIKNFCQLDDNTVFKFKSIDSNISSRSYGNAVPLFRDLGANNLTSEGVAALNKNRQVTKGRRQAKIINFFNGATPNNDIKHRRLSSDEYSLMKGFSAQRCCGIRDVLVTATRPRKKDKIQIGEYTFDDTWSSYAIDSWDMDSPWVHSQREFLDTAIEKSTRKNLAVALQYLNVYLFDYLPYFFQKNSVPYPFPQNISDFRNAIYIAPSDIVAKHTYGATNLAYPVSLIDWLKLAHEGLKDSVAKARVLILHNYFDFVMVRYDGIEGYTLKSNPLGVHDTKRIKGYKYTRSNKKLLDLEYWKLFSEFLSVLAEKLISNIESCNPSPKSGTYSVEINRDIQFGDHKAHIGTLTDLQLPRVQVGTAYYPQPQLVLCYFLMTQCGQRMANIMNLDVRSYDIYFDPSDKYNEFNGVELHINTDKAKTTTSSTQLTYQGFILLRRFVAIRDRIKGVPLEPIPYGGSVHSKWGMVLPILATSETNYYDNSDLPHLLHCFELQMIRAGIQLGTEVFYKPIFNSAKQFFEILNSQESTQVGQYCVHYEEGDSAFFTPIEIGSLVTPHSFRKTLDTYYSVLIGDDATGKFFTGQSEATVGYYREVEPNAIKKINKHIDNISFPNVVPLRAVSKDENDIREKVLSEGLTGINGFTLSVLENDYKLELSAVNPSDIAVNHTHICIYGNQCPPEILSILNQEKNCALCPVSISTPHDGIGVAAQVKYHVDNISEINEQLKDDFLVNSERKILITRRQKELNMACSWYVRHKYLVEHCQRHNEYYVLKDGEKHVSAKLEYVVPSSKNESIYSRLIETQSIPSMQSSKLKQTAMRLTRKLVGLSNSDDFQLPDINPVEAAASMIEKIAAIYGLNIRQLDQYFEHSKQPNIHLDGLLKLDSNNEK